MRGRSRTPNAPHERRSAVRADHAEARRRKRESLSHPREREKTASSALRRGCGHPATREVTARKAFLPKGKKGSAGQGIGFLRKGPGAFP